MRTARWLVLIPAVPVAAVVAVGLAGDWALGVREVRHAPPPEPAAAVTADGPAHPAAAELAFALRSLTAAARDGRTAVAAGSFDAARFHAAVTRADAFRAAGVLAEPVGGAVRARVALVDALRAGGPGLAADAVEVRRVVPGAESDEVIVATRQVFNGRVGVYRWWLVRGADGWRAFDLEDARAGLRLSRQAAGQLAGEVSPAAKAGLAALGPAADKLAAGDPAAADAALAPARAAPLPRDAYAVRCLIEGGVAALAGRVAAAREWADRAEAASPGLPATDFLRASAAAAGREWAAVEAPARAYLDAVGPDAPAARLLGTALRELGRPAEAVAAFEVGLRDDPTRADLRAARDAARAAADGRK